MVVEHRERDARILGVCKIQKARNDVDVLTKPQTANRPGLGRLVYHKDPAGYSEVSELPDNIPFFHWLLGAAAGCCFGSA